MNLERGVAVKVLPGFRDSDLDQMQRFIRQAEFLASLYHPNVAQIYGLEEVSRTRAILIKLVSGSDENRELVRSGFLILSILTSRFSRLIRKEKGKCNDCCHY